MTDYVGTIIEYRVEGPPERDGMVWASPWFKSLHDAITAAERAPGTLDRNKFTVFKRTVHTRIEKFDWKLATCPRCSRVS